MTDPANSAISIREIPHSLCAVFGNQFGFFERKPIQIIQHYDTHHLIQNPRITIPAIMMLDLALSSTSTHRYYHAMVAHQNSTPQF
jgi:hypothetical protein